MLFQATQLVNRQLSRQLSILGEIFSPMTNGVSELRMR